MCVKNYSNGTLLFQDDLADVFWTSRLYSLISVFFLLLFLFNSLHCLLSYYTLYCQSTAFDCVLRNFVVILLMFYCHILSLFMRLEILNVFQFK